MKNGRVPSWPSATHDPRPTVHAQLAARAALHESDRASRPAFGVTAQEFLRLYILIPWLASGSDAAVRFCP